MTPPSGCSSANSGLIPNGSACGGERPRQGIPEGERVHPTELSKRLPIPLDRNVQKQLGASESVCSRLALLSSLKL